MFLASSAVAVNNTTANESHWNFTQEKIVKDLNVGSSSSLNISINNSGNESFSVNINNSGNASNFIYSVQNPVKTIPGENVSVLNQLVVNRDDSFGNYTGWLNGSTSNFSDAIRLKFNVYDNIDPEIQDLTVEDVMATEETNFSVKAYDNLNVSSVEADIYREVNNSNKTVVEDAVFKQNVEGDGKPYVYSFQDTSVIGSYYINVSVTDSSNNTVSKVQSFNVEGLDSIRVLDDNFVFETIRTKDDTSFKLVNSSKDGKEIVFKLESLSYGGNESVEIGVIPPEGSTAETLSVNGSRSYSESGVYRLGLSHIGDNESKGVHNFKGEVLVDKPSQHLKPENVSVSFSGDVKNLDKPAETCMRVGDFNGCIAYSLDRSTSLFEESVDGVESGSKNFAYLIGRIPTSQVEGSDSWGEQSSLTLGEFNDTKQKLESSREKIEDLEGSNGFLKLLVVVIPVSLIVLGTILFVWWLRIGRFVSFAQSKQKIIEKASVKEPEEGLN